MNKYKRLLTNTIVFAIGTFASKLLVLLLTPLYTKILSPEQYSIADLVMQTANLLIPVFTVSIANAVMRFGMDKHEDKAAVFTTGFTTISIGFAALLLCSPALLLLKDGVDAYIPVILVYVLASGMHSLCLQFVRSQGHVKLFAFDGILNTLLTIGFNILFLVGLNMHVTGYLMSTVLADANLSPANAVSNRFFAFFALPRANSPSKNALMCFILSPRFSPQPLYRICAA